MREGGNCLKTLDEALLFVLTRHGIKKVLLKH